MTLNVRYLTSKLQIQLEPQGTVLNFVDTPPITGVTVADKPLNLIDDNVNNRHSYVLFDSLIYPSHYQISNLNNNGFSLTFAFVVDDPNINYYDVTAWVQVYETAATYINKLQCLTNNPNKEDIIDYYALYLATTSTQSTWKRYKVANQEEIEIDTSMTFNNNPWFRLANQLADYCIPTAPPKLAYFGVRGRGCN